MKLKLLAQDFDNIDNPEWQIGDHKDCPIYRALKRVGIDVKEVLYSSISLSDGSHFRFKGEDGYRYNIEKIAASIASGNTNYPSIEIIGLKEPVNMGKPTIKSLQEELEKANKQIERYKGNFESAVETIESYKRGEQMQLDEYKKLQDDNKRIIKSNMDAVEQLNGYLKNAEAKYKTLEEEMNQQEKDYILSQATLELKVSQLEKENKALIEMLYRKSLEK